MSPIGHELRKPPCAGDLQLSGALPQLRGNEGEGERSVYGLFRLARHEPLPAVKATLLQAKPFDLSEPLQLLYMLCGARGKDQGRAVALSLSEPELDHSIEVENTGVAALGRLCDHRHVGNELASAPVLAGSHNAPELGVRTRQVRDCRR